MMDSQKKKNSSIELLRIIAMFFIVFGHYGTHGGFSDRGGLFAPDVCLIYINCIQIFGHTSCAIFSIITGYYTISNNSYYLNQYKRFFKLLAEFIFYSAGVLLMLILINYLGFFKGDYKLTLTFESIRNCLFPIFYGNWYFRTYLFFIIFIPFINVMINNISISMHKFIMIFSFIIWAIIPELTGMDELFGYFGLMFVMYLIGSYIRKYYDKNKYKNSINLFIGIECALLMIVIKVLFCVNSTQITINSIFGLSNILRTLNSVLSGFTAIYLFIFFSNMEFENKIINVIASATLGVYLIHDNDYLRYIFWIVISPNALYANNPFLHSIIKSIAVYAICVIIDLIRQKTIGNAVNKWIDKKYDAFISKYYKKVL